MERGRLRAGKLRGIGVGVVVSIAVLASAVAPAQAKAASPVLEFVSPSAFPINFTVDGGEVTAALAGYDTVVHCAGSHGEGEIIRPRSTLSKYVFTGCETQGGTEGGANCKSEDALNPKEITTGTIEAELVYIDQAKHEVGMLLNPSGGIYMSFECGGELVKARGPFLSPVGPINTGSTSFTATLTRSGATQTPGEYENAIGEKRKAIPMAERGANPLTTTGVELSFAIHTSASLEIKAITAAEIEAKQREEEAAAVKKRQQEEARAERAKRTWLLYKGLTHCRKAKSKHKRVRCERRVKQKYRGARI